MSNITIYHNPRCSKSRATLKLLEEKGLDINIVDYLNTPPSQQDLKNILMMLNISAKELVRKGEDVFKELKLAEATGTQLIKAMHQHPILIERPIVIANGKAAIGRPPENILGIL